MPETGGKSQDGEWAAAWLEQQREALRQSRTEGNQKVESGQGGQDEPPGNAQPHAFDQLLKTWRDAWPGTAAGQLGSAGPFAELLQRMSAIGPWREHAAAWREVAAAQAECQQVERELRAVLFRVQNDALDLVQQRLREGGQTVQDLRGLHKLWVECGEEVYAQVAHGDAYAQLQGQFANATLRLRARQQKVIEQWLKQFDLPTRAELNTVHRQLREQKEKLREHKELLASFVQRMQAPGSREQHKATRAAAPKSKTKKRSVR